MPVPALLLNLLDLRLDLVRFLPVANGFVERDDMILDVSGFVPSPNLQERRILAESTVGAAVVVVVVIVVTVTVVVAVPVASVPVSISRARTRRGGERRHGKVLEMLAVDEGDVQLPARGHVDVFAVALKV